MPRRKRKIVNNLRKDKELDKNRIRDKFSKHSSKEIRNIIDRLISKDYDNPTGIIL